MAVPKCKVSKARRDKRRGGNWKLSAPSVSVCPKCGEPVMPHRACKNCGSYNGRQVLAAKAD
ncbi:MAG: 50S ribosomal protein L32 [Firmicutes bacterium]|nr:50S ribosomal protein L32 [Bacillota bacterium]